MTAVLTLACASGAHRACEKRDPWDGHRHLCECHCHRPPPRALKAWDKALRSQEVRDAPGRYLDEVD